MICFRYNFKFNFPEEEKPPTKCCAFTYSKLLNKLYVRPEQLITIPFSALPLPKKFKLQSFLRFKEQNKVVERCPHHVQNDESEFYFLFEAFVSLVVIV